MEKKEYLDPQVEILWYGNMEQMRAIDNEERIVQCLDDPFSDPVVTSEDTWA